MSDREEDKPRILVVDDEQMMAKTVADILRVKGYDAETAFSGSEAVEKVGVRSFDAVFMDIKMPKVNGVEAFVKIKSIAPELPVVMMTAYSDDELVAQAREQGVLGILIKPLDFTVILSFLSVLEKEKVIFIIDDDREFCRTLSGVLQKRTFNVRYETDPFKAMNCLKTEEVGMVLLDMKLDGTNGLEVLRKIRGKYPYLPVILITGYVDEMDASLKKGLELSAFAYLYKPLEMEKLFSLLEEVNRKKLRDALGER